MSVVEQADVRRLLRPLSERPMEVLEPSVRHARREQSIARIQQVLEEAADNVHPLRPRSVFWVKASMVAGLAAAFALALGQLWPARTASIPSPLRVVSTVGDVACRSGGDEGSWQRCETVAKLPLTGVRCNESATTELETTIGARLILMPSSALFASNEVGQPRTNRVRLTQGRVDVTVPKLGSNQSFEVETATATVIVHGTAFSVSIVGNAQGKTGTCVELREGVITVKSGAITQRLVAPALFGCELEPSKPAGDVELEAPEPGASKADASASSKKKSTLALEIRLLQQGLGAEQRKDRVAAERFYRGLLKRYPNSIVAPEARAALERLRTEIPAAQ